MIRVLVALFLFVSSASAEMREASFTSASLGREVGYGVQLPPSYGTGQKKYPVLYALHGLFENHSFWERRGLAPALDEMWAKGEVPEFLVVTVDGGNSFFTNGPNGPYEDLVTRDLVAHVESTYRVIPGRQGRALMGISMGGYAALRIAFKLPALFRAVSTHSAMLLLKMPTAEDGARRGQMAAFQKTFGDPIDLALWKESDPFTWVEKVAPKEVPDLSFDCGSEDRYGLFTGNQELHKRLEARGIKHEFSLAPGDHGYEFVRAVLPGSLRFVGRSMGGAQPPGASPAQKEKK